MERKINGWLARWGHTYKDADFGYADCDMIDSCLHDLGLKDDHRTLVGKLVDAYIAAH
jgi:hypothetical protein